MENVYAYKGIIELGELEIARNVKMVNITMKVIYNVMHALFIVLHAKILLNATGVGMVLLFPNKIFLDIYYLHVLQFAEMDKEVMSKNVMTVTIKVETDVIKNAKFKQITVAF